MNGEELGSDHVCATTLASPLTGVKTAKTWALSAAADFETMSVPETNRCKHQ